MAKLAGPTFFYDPSTGEGRVFEDEAAVPKGWLDHVSLVPQVERSVDPMSRAEIVAALEAGGVSFAAKAKTGDLYELLASSLKAALKEAGIAHAEGATARDMLTLLQGE